MRKILVFGGTFNPIHMGHLLLYRHFADFLAVDQVLLIPTKIPPHKTPRELASGEHRLALCRIATQDDPRVQVSDMELRRPGVSYTVDTLEQLRARHPQTELYLAVGSDMLLTLDRWKACEQIMQLATVCALARHQEEYTALLQKKEELERQFHAKILLHDAKTLEISSTQLRGMVKEEGDLAHYLPPGVAEYIKRNGLYRTDEI